jgi:hypothetical protein
VSQHNNSKNNKEQKTRWFKTFIRGCSTGFLIRGQVQHQLGYQQRTDGKSKWFNWEEFKEKTMNRSVDKVKETYKR